MWRALRFDRRGLQPLWRSRARGEREEAIAARSRSRWPGRSGIARSIVLLESFVAGHWIPRRRRDLARLAVFADPSTSLKRPVSDVKHPKDIILENDDLPVSRCGLDRVAHLKHAHSDDVIGPFLLHFANTVNLFHRWEGLKYPFWLGHRRNRSRSVSPPCHARGCRNLYHQATKGRAYDRRMAGGYGSLDPGGDARRADDVRAHRCHEGFKPPRRARFRRVAKAGFKTSKQRDRRRTRSLSESSECET